MYRPVAPFLFASVWLVPQVFAQNEPDPRGTYAFQSTSTRGDPFEGAVHLYGEPDHVQGFVYTTIDAPIPVTGVRWLGRDTLGIRFSLGPTVVTQVFAFSGDRFTGRYGFTRNGETREIPLTGERLPRTTANPDLQPTPCEMPGAPYDAVGAMCAMLHVPEDPDRPDGRVIPLRIVILPARTETPAPDALFMFAGGPGQAATDITGGYAGTTAEIRRQRDVVIVDQRGTGASNPLRCTFDDPRERAALLFSWRFPPELDDCRATLSERADLRLYHSWIAAADIERVRDWLGYPQIDLYGGSYGTRMAQAYLARYPDRVRTATLRGVEPPGGILPLENPRDGQAAVELVFAECAEEQACHAAFPDLEGDLAQALTVVEQTPGAVRVRDPVTGDSVVVEVTRAVFAGALRRLLMNGESIPLVPLAVHAAARGDYTVLAPGISSTLGVSRSLYIGMSLSVGCSEDADHLAASDVRGLTAGTFMGPGPAEGFLDACARWPRGDVPPEFYQPVRADVPVLLLSGRYDPATPVRWARAVAEALPNALHIVMPGISHSPFPECAQEVMTQFVRRGGMVGVNADCLRDLERGAFRLPG